MANRDKKHIVFLTIDEMKALANVYRVGIQVVPDGTPYIEELHAKGGKSGFDKLVEKIKEINDDPNG